MERADALATAASTSALVPVLRNSHCTSAVTLSPQIPIEIPRDEMLSFHMLAELAPSWPWRAVASPTLPWRGRGHFIHLISSNSHRNSHQNRNKDPNFGEREKFPPFDRKRKQCRYCGVLRAPPPKLPAFLHEGAQNYRMERLQLLISWGGIQWPRNGRVMVYYTCIRFYYRY